MKGRGNIRITSVVKDVMVKTSTVRRFTLCPSVKSNLEPSRHSIGVQRHDTMHRTAEDLSIGAASALVSANKELACIVIAVQEP